LTFQPEHWGGCEAAKIAPLVVRYMQGRSLDIGSGPGKVWPSAIGVDIARRNGRPVTDICLDGRDLKMFGDETMDAVFSSFFLHQLPEESVPTVLREWARVLKVGGHLILYLPHELPEGADEAQRWTPTPETIQDMLPPGGWEIVERETRAADDEYGFLLVARRLEKRAGLKEALWERNPGGKKRALVVRYGAIGDAIVAASIFPGLKKQGYHLTVNCHAQTHDVLRHDPHVDEWLIQDKDFVPNELLGPYWLGLEERYDRIVNLCESVEGLFLTLPGRLNHGYSDDARRAIYGSANYLEHTHNIAGVPHEFAARFYPTGAELEKARWDYRKMGGPVVVWCVNGSSPHKIWPWVHIVCKWLLDRTPARIVLYGDPGVGKALAKGVVDCLTEDGADVSRVRAIAGEWELRRSLTFAHVVDCVVGPETGPLNAVGMADVPKVIYLSHSSAANLTKHWLNTTTLVPDVTRAPCYPCHRLHSTWEYCHKDEKTAAALCASSIAPEAVFAAIAEALGAKRIAA
jgi:ADP-heptose:LPS heptosyltransferase